MVGSFIDSETLLAKKKKLIMELLNYQRKQLRDTQDYSQGSIQYFEILKTEERNGILLLKQKLKF